MKNKENSGARRIVMIEEPGENPALCAVLKRIGPENCTIVRMVHDGLGRLRGEPVRDLLSGLERVLDDGPKLASIDLIGHGAPGVLMLGGTYAGRTQIEVGGGREWAMLDTDVDKLLSLIPFARTLRHLDKRHRLDDGFEIRLLGCNTAVDPGIVPTPSLALLQDGSVLIHLLASFLDQKVRGMMEYIGPENFEHGVFEDGGRSRSCVLDGDNKLVTFDPPRIVAPTKTPDSLELMSVVKDPKSDPVFVRPGTPPVNVKPERVATLFAAFPKDAFELSTKNPLVIVDGTIRIGASSVDIAEQGRALVVRKDGRVYRARGAREENDASNVRTTQAGQIESASFLQDVAGETPSWAR